MCTRPGKIVTLDHEIRTQCRKCAECIAARRRHWIGRLLAEQETCDHVWFSTFTYGGGYENDDAYMLDYSDVQKMFKRLRRAGFKFKYLAVGEYGGKKGRAHWHVMFFWQGDPPEVQMNERINWDFWEHGFSKLEHPRSKHGAAIYLMDYMSKQNLAGAELKYSKVPQLGEDYLLEYAREHAREGLALFAAGNTFTVKKNSMNARSGKPFYYPVGTDEAMYIKMLQAYVEEWAIHRPTQPIARSSHVDSYMADISQNPEKQPLATQQYLKAVYGYESATEFNWEQELSYVTTVTLEPRANVVFTKRTAVYQWLSPDLRTVEWRYAFEKADGAIGAAISPEDMRRAAKAHAINPHRKKQRSAATSGKAAHWPTRNPSSASVFENQDRPGTGGTQSTDQRLSPTTKQTPDGNEETGGGAQRRRGKGDWGKRGLAPVSPARSAWHDEGVQTEGMRPATSNARNHLEATRPSGKVEHPKAG